MPKNDNPGAVELLEEDHQKVKDLFEKFEKAKDESEKDEIADQVDLELRIHSMIEEEILYPAVQAVDSEIVAESFEEHGVVEELLNELATMELGDEQFDAKFKVMKENVEHHIEEEEGTMFPQCRDLPNYEELGLQLIQRKMQLKEQLGMLSDSSDRATTGAEPATMLASEKSEALAGDGATSMAKEKMEPKAKETPKESRSTPRSKSAASGRRSSRAATTSSRRK
jgi:hemerythrin superfamily protein